jgi:hypothetical protein
VNQAAPQGMPGVVGLHEQPQVLVRGARHAMKKIIEPLLAQVLELGEASRGQARHAAGAQVRQGDHVTQRQEVQVSAAREKGNVCERSAEGGRATWWGASDYSLGGDVSGAEAVPGDVRGVDFEKSCHGAELDGRVADH